MKKAIVTLCCAGVLTAMSSMNASAVDLGGTTVDVNVSADLLSKYVWRGIPLTDDFVLQPGVTAGLGGFSINAWSNVNLGFDDAYESEMNELDFTLDYSFEAGPVSASVGLVYYTFPNTDFDPTTEVYVGLSSTYTKDASLTLFQDVDLVEGLYASLGYDYSVPVADVTSLDFSAALGFGTSDHNVFYYGADVSGITDLFIGVSAPFTVAGSVSVCPSLGLSTILNSDIKDSYDLMGMDDTNLLFGVGASVDF